MFEVLCFDNCSPSTSEVKMLYQAIGACDRGDYRDWKRQRIATSVHGAHGVDLQDFVLALTWLSPAV